MKLLFTLGYFLDEFIIICGPCQLTMLLDQYDRNTYIIYKCQENRFSVQSFNDEIEKHLRQLFETSNIYDLLFNIYRHSVDFLPPVRYPPNNMYIKVMENSTYWDNFQNYIKGVIPEIYMKNSIYFLYNKDIFDIYKINIRRFFGNHGEFLFMNCSNRKPNYFLQKTYCLNRYRREPPRGRNFYILEKIKKGTYIVKFFVLCVDDI